MVPSLASHYRKVRRSSVVQSKTQGISLGVLGTLTIRHFLTNVRTSLAHSGTEQREPAPSTPVVVEIKDTASELLDKLYEYIF